ncbi:MAG: UDP-N-acetylmuramoyl-L-alanine--D-glutamate ligase, partial [Candidatus Caldarchaeum sp.]
KAGAKVIAADQKSGDAPEILRALDEVGALPCEVITGWSGDVDWSWVDVIATSPGVPRSHPVLSEAVARGVPIWSELEVAQRVSRAPFVAITGTNGKSTVSALTAFILKECGIPARLCGNIAGSGFEEETVCNAALAASPQETLITEASSFQLEWIHTFKPEVAVITQIVPDHFDRYESFEEYCRTKHRIYQNMNHEDVLIVNRFRPETYPSKECRARVVYFGLPGDTVRIEKNALYLGDTLLTEEELWCTGPATLENVATAFMLAHQRRVSETCCLQAVRRFPGLSHRMERVGEWRGVTFINNSMCTNPVATSAALAGLGAPVRLLAGGVCKVPDLSPFAQEAHRVRKAYLFGRDASHIALVFQEAGTEAEVFNTIEDALYTAVKEAMRGEVVLLAPGCASFDQFENFIQRGDTFRRLVKGMIGNG